jgi:dihydrofolate reductase
VLQLNARKPELNFWIIGGAMVFDEALAKGIVDEIYLTLVHSTCDGDVTLKTDLAAWKLFVLSEAKLGRVWAATFEDAIWDGEHQTTYITLHKAPNV